MSLEHVAGRNAGRLMLYALSTCPWCRRIKNLLNELGVAYDFTDVDLLKGEERAEAIKAVKKWSLTPSFPTLVIDDLRVIFGFRENEIRAVLKSE